MTEWQAVILEAQLQRYPEQLERRRTAALHLDKLLNELAGVTPQRHDERMTRHAYYCYVFRVGSLGEGAERAKVVFDALTSAGAPLSLAYPALGELDVFKHNRYAPTIRRAISPCRMNTPIASAVAAQTIWIHHRALLASPKALDGIVRVVEQALGDGA